MTITEKGVLPNADALQNIADLIWQQACITGQTPLVLTSTLGPIHQLRKILHKQRPKDINLEITFLPPIYSVNQWLEQCPELLDFPPVKTTIERWEMVYEELQKHKKIQNQFGAIGEGGRWALAKSIIEACDFLTKSNISFAFYDVHHEENFYEQAQQEFEKTLKESYKSLEFNVAQEEGELILAFWKFLSNTEDPLVRERMAYQFKIQSLSQTKLAPLIWIEMAKPSKTIQILQDELLACYAQHQIVLKIGFDWQQSGLWPECISGKVSTNLEEYRKETFSNRQKYTDHQWRVIAQPSFETMAWAALVCIHEHISAGRQQIALVAQDRLIARRIRALLARYGSNISINDQTGWTLSTTSAAAAVHSYLEILKDSEGPELGTLMGFLKNPMLDWKEILKPILKDQSIDIEDFAWWMESKLLASSVGIGWTELQHVFVEKSFSRHEHPLVEIYSPIAKELLLLLERRSKDWQQKKIHSQDWVLKLEEDLQAFGMFFKLSEDAAGQIILRVIEQLKLLNLSRLNLTAWISLFDQCVEQENFVQKSPKKQIHIEMIPISGIRLRTYSAVVVVGCHDKLLPRIKDHGSIFSKAMLYELDPELPEAEYIQQARDLSQLLTSHQYVDLLWQEYQRAEEKNRLSNWLSRLHIDMPNLEKKKIQLPTNSIDKSDVFASKTKISDSVLLPDKLSPSAYKVLRSCPYRFYVNYLLKLSSPKALREINEFGIVGTLLHDILNQFYKEYQGKESFISKAEKLIWMEEQLLQISHIKWQELISKDGKLIAMQEEWFGHVPEIVAWQIGLEEKGWSFFEAEKDVEFFLQLETGDSLKIYGRVDRVDRNEDGNLLVLDYKFKNGKDLSNLNKTLWDDPQLLIYSKAISLLNQERGNFVQEASWVSLGEASADKRNLSFAVTPEKIDELDQKLLQDLNPIWKGHMMPANGITKTCNYCDARGICRKGMWHDE